MTVVDGPNSVRLNLPTARSRGIGYQNLLDTDTHHVPDVLRQQNPFWYTSDDVPTKRYTSREFFELEKEKLWKTTWQMACREDDIAEVGDTLVYEITDMSFLLVRSAPDRIQAYWNACLHRGRLLREYDGNTPDLRCPFHGYCWELDGSLKQVPAAWDFPHVDRDAFHLPEVAIGYWGGFVFINPDPNAAPFAEHVAGLDAQFERWPLERRFKEAHVAKIIHANWKVVQEAFMEAYHVVATHPQLLAGIGDENTQYDAWNNFSRAITLNGTPSPHIGFEPSEQDRLDAMLDRRLDEPRMMIVPDDSTARATAANGARATLRPLLGDHVDDLCDAELVDSFYYTLFPNFHPWGAYNRIVYRFRPNGDDHNSAIMECMYLSPYDASKPKPPSVPIHWLTAEDDWTLAPELGVLACVFNQDIFNLPKVQRGLRTMQKPGVTLANYQESKIRHFHSLLENKLDL